MSTELVKSVMGSLEKRRDQIESFLPKACGMTPESFLASVHLTILNDDSLVAYGAKAIAQRVFEAARLGLSLDKNVGHCYLIGYKNWRSGKKELQLQFGYKGVVHILRRSGVVDQIEAMHVYEGDEYGVFNVDNGPPRLWVKPAYFADDRGKAIGAVAWFIKDGRVISQKVMSASELKEYHNNTDAWKKHPEAMERKTVVLAGRQFLPLSPDTEAAIGHIEAVERGDESRIIMQEVQGLDDEVNPDDANNLLAVAEITGPPVIDAEVSEPEEEPVKPEKKAPKFGNFNEAIQAFKELGMGEQKLIAYIKKNPPDWDVMDLAKLANYYRQLVSQ
jgi:recombination protein RecT